jgi:RHS repeat-associated protein
VYSGGKCSVTGTLVGDPIDVGYRDSYYSHLDLSISNAYAPFEFVRYFSTSLRTWGYDTTLAGVPKAFGESLADNSQNWWHNWYSFVYSGPGYIRVRLRGGRFVSLPDCTTVAGYCWAPLAGSEEGIQVHRVPGGYSVIERDGTIVDYFAQAASGSIYFLSQLTSSRGELFATVTYAQPKAIDGSLLACTAGASSDWVPYISSIALAEGAPGSGFNFRYQLQRDGSCGLVSVSAGSPAGATMTYAYWDLVHPTWGKGARLRSAGYSAATTEYYGYGYVAPGDGYIGTSPGATTGGGVSSGAVQSTYTSTVIPGPTLPRIQFGRDTTQCTNTWVPYPDGGWDGGTSPDGGWDGGSSPVRCGNRQLVELDPGGNQVVFSEVDPAGEQFVFLEDAGVSADGKPIRAFVRQMDSSYVKYSYTLAPASGYDAPRVSSIKRECPVSANPSAECGAATPSVSWTWDAGPTGLEHYHSVYDSLGRKFVEGVSGASGAGGIEGLPTLLTTGEANEASPAPPASMSGATTPGYCYGAECLWLGYTTTTAGSVKVSYSYSPSPLHGGAPVMTQATYSGGGQLLQVIQEGYTYEVGATTPSQRFVGTFYRTTATASGNCGGVTGFDSHIVEVQGPCLVSSMSATGCSEATYPIRQFSYYPKGGPTNDAGRLAFVREFPNGCSGAALTTTFAGYTSIGKPTAVTPPSGPTTTYVYDAATGRLSSVTRNSNTWTLGYNLDGKVNSVRLPQGNYINICYGLWTTSGAFRACDAEGDQIGWVAKGASDWDTNWSEMVQYMYAPASGRLQSIRFQAGGSNVPRRSISVTQDLLKRTNYVQDGPQAVSVMGYDTESQLRAIGKWMNGPEAYCRDATGNYSTKCDLLTYDSAGRLKTLTSRLQNNGSTSVNTSFGYDADGNPCEVAIGDGLSNCSPTGSARGSGVYETDDFGNVVTYYAPSTSGTTKLAWKFRYDARGNRVQKVLPSGADYRFTYDQIGRPLLDQQVAKVGLIVTTTTLYSRTWDAAARTPCMTNVNQNGRLASVSNPVGTTYFSYDADGRVAAESLVRYGETACTTNGTPRTLYTYSPNGNLLTMTYPHGRQLRYEYGTGGLTDRVSAVYSYDWNGSIWTQTRLLSGVTWEPFGGLRSYHFDTPTGTSTQGEVDYDPTGSAAGGLIGGSLEGIVVSSGAAGVVGDLLRVKYSYSGSESPQSIQTCLNAGVSVSSSMNCPKSRLDTYTYDMAERLVHASSSSTGAAGWGPGATFNPQLSARGNITSLALSSGSYTMQYGNPAPDQLTAECLPSGFCRNYSYDAVGRVSQVGWQADSSGGTNAVRAYTYSGAGIPSVGDEVVKTVSVNGALYTYVYNERNHRMQKIYPSGVRDEFYYSLDGHLLEDVNTARADGVSVMDEYVWLGGRVVSARRSKFTGNWATRVDVDTNCSRGMEGALGGTPAVSCGVRSIVTGALGQPLLSVDRSGKITGVGEFDAFGHVNRVRATNETNHSYVRASSIDWGISQPTLGMNLLVRAHFPVVDTEKCGTGLPSDWAQLQTPAGVAISPKVGGHHAGETWTPWYSLTSAGGQAKVHFESDDDNYPPLADGTCDTNSGGYAMSGIVYSDYEYLRYATGAVPYFPPLRFAGQYFDAETDAVENWNRYYEPTTGRYLTPEPMLQWSRFVSAMIGSGLAAPAYAYAANRPTQFVDVDGLSVVGLTVGDQIELDWYVPGWLADRRMGSDFARMYFDPIDTAYYRRLEPGSLIEDGGGRTSGRHRKNAGGYFCESQVSPVDADAYHEKYRTSWPPLSYIRAPIEALIAHELGHQFDNFYGLDRSLDWDNDVRVRLGIPPRTGHYTPHHPSAPLR